MTRKVLFRLSRLLALHHSTYSRELVPLEITVELWNYFDFLLGTESFEQAPRYPIIRCTTVRCTNDRFPIILVS